MATILLSVATYAELPFAQQTLKSAAKAFAKSKSVIYVLDADDSALQSDVHSAAELLPQTYFDEAFFFNKEELRVRVAVAAMAKICSENDTVMFVMPGIEYSGEAINVAADSAVCTCKESDTALPHITTSLANMHKFEPNIMVFAAGEKVNSYLKWCADKMQWIYNTACLPYMFGNIKKHDIAEMNRDFMQNFLSYAVPLGCAVNGKTMQQFCTSFMKEKIPTQYKYDYLAEGLPVFDLLRDYYGDDYRLREACAGNPFKHPELFCEKSALTGDTNEVPVPPIAIAFYNRRTDIKAAFQNPFGAQREAFINWFCAYGAAEKGISEKWTAPLKAKVDAVAARNAANDKLYRSLSYRIKSKLGMIKHQQPEQKNYPFGVNLCGFIKGDFGLGVSTRMLADVLTEADIPFTIVDFQTDESHSYTNEAWAHKITNTFIYSVNLMLTNANGLQIFMSGVAPEALENRYNIGFWYWELPECPPEYKQAFELVDEVWTSSKFTAEALRAVSGGKPVTAVLHSVEENIDASLMRADFGIPQNKFVFLTMYDVLSTNARKNPDAAVKAFMKAFGDRQDVMLVLKLNAMQLNNSTAEVEKLIEGHSNIMLLCGTYSKLKINSLVNLCDAFLSLHRSEGFGLGPAEAMYFGKPAVLTNWSGNTDYMRDNACCPVKYEIVEIDKDYDVYKKGWHWAEADTDDAAQWMKRLVDDKEFYKTISENGAKVIKSELSIKAVSKLVKDRFIQLNFINER